jgi:hypothetical protein
LKIASAGGLWAAAALCVGLLLLLLLLLLLRMPLVKAPVLVATRSEAVMQ